MEQALRARGRELDAQHQLAFSEAQKAIHDLQDAVGAYSQVKVLSHHMGERWMGLLFPHSPHSHTCV